MSKQSLFLKSLLGVSALVPVCLAASAAGVSIKLPPKSNVTAAASTPATPTADKVLLRHADNGTYDTDKNIVSVDGHVEIDYKGRVLLADKVVYDIDADLLTAEGNVSLMNESGDVAFADHVRLTDQMRDGVLDSFGALLGQNGRLAATTANRTDEGRITEARRAVYTNCKVCREPGQRTPLWQIKAVKLVHDKVKQRITFDDATLELFDVPVLYTPYLSMPDPSVKYASGILTPDAGNSSTIGYFVRVPYYFAISDSEDATLEPLVSTSGGIVMEGEYRKRWENSGLWLQGSVAENPNGGIDENQQQYYSHLFGSGSFALTDGWQPGQGWQAGFDTQITSKNTYLKRYDISEADRLNNDLFIVGENGRSRFAVTGYFFQSLRLSDDNETIPVALPLIEYSYVPMSKWAGGQFRFNASTVALSRDVGTNDQRVSTEANWRRPFVADDGELWTFQLNARGDFFHSNVDTDVVGTTTTTTSSDSHYTWRGMTTAALDWRWPFISSGKSGRSIIFEPIAQLIAAPYGGNPKTITDEDSYSLHIDDNNIFSFDQVPGHDLIDSGPRANVGFRLENRFDGGYVEALLGQSLRLKADPIYEESSGESGTTSDLIGRFSIRFPPYVDLTHRIDYDENTGKVRRDEVYLTGNYGKSSLQLNYVQLSASDDISAREELSTQAAVNVYENWQVFAAIRRDLIADQTLTTEYGMGYEDECFGISLSYRRKYTTDMDLKPSSTILFHFNLKTTDQQSKPFSLFPHDIFSYTRS
ncbi:MAG: LPS assembly protein LptD [Rhizomicrobium sp.]